jgi:hypothetical protein
MAKSRKGSRKHSKKTSRSRKLHCSKGSVKVKSYKRSSGKRVKAHCSRVGKRRAASRGSYSMGCGVAFRGTD